ncbi:MAG TPA: DUF2147 domain-containing protein [Sphingomicrobium sp.]|nr:DUF2147 domain-containing protein [Sphingomicrobium sp.]
MKYLFLSIAAIAAAAAPAAARDPIEGLWKHGPMVVEIAPCGDDLCGTVVKASPLQQQKAERGSGTRLIGSRLITGIEPTGPGSYRGRVFAADRNVYASGSVHQLSPNELEVKGCVLMVICKSRTYVRVR